MAMMVRVVPAGYSGKGQWPSHTRQPVLRQGGRTEGFSHGAVSFLNLADVSVSKFGEDFESTFVLRNGEGMQLPCNDSFVRSEF
jgi:hypothetical protein